MNENRLGLTIVKGAGKESEEVRKKVFRETYSESSQDEWEIIMFQ